MVNRIRSRMPRIGTRKLYFLLKEDIKRSRIKMGRDLLFSFLGREHLLILPKKRYIKTTNSKHWLKKHKNIIKGIKINRPEQVWVSDITYIKTEDGHNFLSLITDVYSKKIMGYELLNNLSTEGPLKALQMALKNRKYKWDLIHHSDRGLQYCSKEYISLLRSNNIKVSMTESYDPYENAVAERVNGILKEEFLLAEGFRNHLTAVKTIKESISIYNNERPHLSCQMLTPNQTHKQRKITIKKWTKKPQERKSLEV
jgi:putative transposase